MVTCTIPRITVISLLRNSRRRSWGRVLWPIVIEQSRCSDWTTVTLESSDHRVVAAAAVGRPRNLSRSLYKTVEHRPSVCHFVIRLRPRRWSSTELLLQPGQRILLYRVVHLPITRESTLWTFSDCGIELNRVNCCPLQRSRRRDLFSESRSRWGCLEVEPVVWG